MREILFRGKRTDNGEWVYGSLRVCGDRYLPQIITLPDEFDICHFCDVDPSTVGQDTGLTDNGKRIFEGDIIQFHKFRDEPDWVGVVKHEHCSYIAVGRMPLAYEKKTGEEPYFSSFEVQMSGIDKTTIKVIGNIHDNPELTEVDHE